MSGAHPGDAGGVEDEVVVGPDGRDPPDGGDGLYWGHAGRSVRG